MPDKFLSRPRYHDPFFDSCQGKLEAAVARGMPEKRLEEFFVSLHSDKSSAINTTDAQEVTMGSLERKILRPRQDLYLFILYNWIVNVFIPSLDPAIARGLLVFGVGRIFSAYSDIGVQYCTDADLNFVVEDSMPKAHVDALERAVRNLKHSVWDLFGIIVEVDAAFTVLRARDIKARLEHRNRDTRVAATLFYKGNAESLFVIHDNPPLRAEIFSPIRPLPDSLLFENFIGDNPVKTTFTRLKEDSAKLTIFADSTRAKEEVDSVIGTGRFSAGCRRLSAIHPELYPKDWWFSMKYSVNRVYDYVSAMRHSGYSLKAIGFTGAKDPDYAFLSQSHRLMLYLQELIHVKLDTYSHLSDYSYVSADRFESLTAMPKCSFQRDFDEIVLSSNFLLASERKHYLSLKESIKAKARVHVSLTADEQSELTRQYGFTFRHVDSGSGRTPVELPYTCAGLGFFVFNAVEGRLSSIVEGKLIPALDRICP
jgi:hypothetical protein